MKPQEALVSYSTIVRREAVRVFRLWRQTLLSPLVSNGLFLWVFGLILGPRSGLGSSYADFLVPGLVVMSVAYGSFTNLTTSTLTSKLQGALEELIVTPTPPLVVVLGLASGGVIRGILVGLVVGLLGFFTTGVPPGWQLLPAALVTSLLFSFGGLWVGLRAEEWSQISWPAELVIRPLFLLGGVFVPVSELGLVWQAFNCWNPCFYLTEAARQDPSFNSLLLPLLLLPLLCSRATYHLRPSK